MLVKTYSINSVSSSAWTLLQELYRQGYTRSASTMSTEYFRFSAPAYSLLPKRQHNPREHFTHTCHLSHPTSYVSSSFFTSPSPYKYTTCTTNPTSNPTRYLFALFSLVSPRDLSPSQEQQQLLLVHAHVVPGLEYTPIHRILHRQSPTSLATSLAQAQIGEDKD